ncbi:MAG: 2-phospho-L-lactate transferase [Anaerolineae bacterium]|nr:2-phospho-L-lactate transferase [Anaerolineae bacterium]MDQ7034170.1 2-phospho-L-lactate transferase [Anaerolineae bacterium]
MALIAEKNIVVFVGGVGGAKLALGLQQVVAPEHLTTIVNTGDDFWHYGLRICPDIDTVLYTLSGRVDPINGWGLSDDSTIMLETLRSLGEDAWFTLRDKDLATHLLRTKMLREGYSLTDVVGHLAKVQGIQPTVLPMTDAEVPTIVNTVEHGELEFQSYFVQHRWQPTVKSLYFKNIDQATMTDSVRQAIQNADIILFAPSNPWLSIAPILSVPGMRDAIIARDVPRVAVTPIIQGKAVKGPAAKLMGELGYDVSPSSVAAYYEDVLTGFVYDIRDENVETYDLKTISFDTMMLTDEDKARLAREILIWLNEREFV